MSLGQGRGGGVSGYAVGVSFASRRLGIRCVISRAIAFATFAAFCYASLALKSANYGCTSVILVDGDPRTSPTLGSPGVRNAPRRSCSISSLNSKGPGNPSASPGLPCIHSRKTHATYTPQLRMSSAACRGPCTCSRRQRLVGRLVPMRCWV